MDPSFVEPRKAYLRLEAELQHERQLRQQAEEETIVPSRELPLPDDERIRHIGPIGS